MTRKLPAVAAALAALLLLGADDPTKDVEKALHALNEAFEKGDADAIKKLVTEDHVAVTGYYGGPLKRDEQLKAHDDLKYTEYRPAKLKVSPLGKDAALVTYELTLKGTYKGKDLPRKNFASAVWVRRDGKWLEAYYQETPLDGK
jgi:uncharacterized protein (TIGR02246 family)